MVFTPRSHSYVHTLSLVLGAVAQLIERFVRNEEVVGLIPICSTNAATVCSSCGWLQRISGRYGAVISALAALLVRKLLLLPPSHYTSIEKLSDDYSGQQVN